MIFFGSRERVGVSTPCSSGNAGNRKEDEGKIRMLAQPLYRFAWKRVVHAGYCTDSKETAVGFLHNGVGDPVWNSE